MNLFYKQVRREKRSLLNMYQELDWLGHFLKVHKGTFIK